MFAATVAGEKRRRELGGLNDSENLHDIKILMDTRFLLVSFIN